MGEGVLDIVWMEVGVGYAMEGCQNDEEKEVDTMEGYDLYI